MLSMDLTSSGLGAGTWAERSCGGLGWVCGGVAGEAAGDCAAAATLQSERAAANVRSLNLTVCPPLARIGPETIPQQSRNCAAESTGTGSPIGIHFVRRVTRRRLGLRLRRWTQICSEAQSHRRRCWRSDFRRVERSIVSSISLLLLWANFFQRGPTGALSRRPWRKSLISP